MWNGILSHEVPFLRELSFRFWCSLGARASAMFLRMIVLIYFHYVFRQQCNKITRNVPNSGSKHNITFIILKCNNSSYGKPRKFLISNATLSNSFCSKIDTYHRRKFYSMFQENLILQNHYLLYLRIYRSEQY